MLICLIAGNLVESTVNPEKLFFFFAEPFIYSGRSWCILCTVADNEISSLNSTAAAILGLFIRDGAMTGGAVVRHANSTIGDFWSLTRSQIYRELLNLEKRGYLIGSPPGPRDERTFQATSAGEAAFKVWLANVPEKETTRVPMLLVLGFGSMLDPKDLAEMLKEFRRSHEAKLDACKTADAAMRAGKFDPFVRATLSFELHYEEGVLRWLDSLPREITRP